MPAEPGRARPLGRPRVHFRTTTSTNDRARELAHAGAPHGTLVSAGEQTAGRGRQGRRWSAPAGRALLISLVLRERQPLATLAAGVAVAEVVGPSAGIKWPNDVVLADGRKVAGILGESRPAEDWTVLGIGLNVAVRPGDLPAELTGRAGSMERRVEDVEPILELLVERLERWLDAPAGEVLAAWRGRDAIAGREVAWSDGCGTAAGIDDCGRLLVRLDDGGEVALEAGEVHLDGHRIRP
jgi:BirA family biotin operon repressor/biotin-[acetyl-CoA-carboxylase] ligase